MKRTDVSKIVWPKGISSSDRRHCRNIINVVRDKLQEWCPPGGAQHISVACSAGLDSTVLAHAFSQAVQISEIQDRITRSIIYVNHQLRSKKVIEKEITHVFGMEWFHYHSVCDINIPEGVNVQEAARTLRYKALANEACVLDESSQHVSPYTGPIILLAHHANDVAESKLFQFLTGRNVIGIHETFIETDDCGVVVRFARPLLSFTKEDLVRYAKAWGLGWREDESNETGKYARNRIRNKLIPWIEKKINPGIVKLLADSKHQVNFCSTESIPKFKMVDGSLYKIDEKTGDLLATSKEEKLEFARSMQIPKRCPGLDYGNK